SLRMWKTAGLGLSASCCKGHRSIFDAVVGWHPASSVAASSLTRDNNGDAVNLGELEEVLKARGVRDDLYSLSGGLAEDTLCIDEIYGKWFVYYAERGKKWDEKEFDSEDAACKHFLKLIEDIG
ncbi:MAG TPA: hypothetical protein VG317_00715, partial [Pseudonocardiaceae bacterium]|nr:hypothetical protein [Pseudonocardiaceae bacterium]